MLQVASKANLKLNSEKCQLGRTQLKFIGDIHAKDGICPDPEKVCAITSIPRPKCKKDFQRLLDMVSYLAKLIHDLSTKTASLGILLDKEIE